MTTCVMLYVRARARAHTQRYAARRNAD